MTTLRDHWEHAYQTKAETAVSWFQQRPGSSLRLIASAGDVRAGILDMGGGASTLPDSLLDAGYKDITVLDISETALAKSRARLATAAAKVQWIAADITAWRPTRTWDIWHDRAVFHFLTAPDTQEPYIGALLQGTHPGSTAIIATFAPDGPERCSGLQVQRYSAAALAERIGAPFTLVAQHAERHTTPGGAVQSFIYAVLKRAANP